MVQLTATLPIVREEYVRHARDSCWGDDHFDFEDVVVKVAKEGSEFVLAAGQMGEEHCTGD